MSSPDQFRFVELSRTLDAMREFFVDFRPENTRQEYVSCCLKLWSDEEQVEPMKTTRDADAVRGLLDWLNGEAVKAKMITIESMKAAPELRRVLEAICRVERRLEDAYTRLQWDLEDIDLHTGKARSRIEKRIVATFAASVEGLATDAAVALDRASDVAMAEYEIVQWRPNGPPRPDPTPEDPGAYSAREIAKRVGKTVGAVSKRLERYRVESPAGRGKTWFEARDGDRRRHAPKFTYAFNAVARLF